MNNELNDMELEQISSGKELLPFIPFFPFLGVRRNGVNGVNSVNVNSVRNTSVRSAVSVRRF